LADNPGLEGARQAVPAAAIAQKQQSRGPNWKSAAALPGPTDWEKKEVRHKLAGRPQSAATARFAAFAQRGF